MEENPSRVSRKDGSHRRMKRSRNTVDEGVGGGDLIECSGKYCKSCTAGLIADCVALCCCPCALVNLFALAFVKIPWTVGRKCLGSVKRKRNKKKNIKQELQRKCKKSSASEEFDDNDNDIDYDHNDAVVIDIDGNFRKGRPGFGLFVEEEEDMGRVSVSSPRFEAERVWLEMYQVGHLGFGRVSFTGTQ